MDPPDGDDLPATSIAGKWLEPSLRSGSASSAAAPLGAPPGLEPSLPSNADPAGNTDSTAASWLAPASSRRDGAPGNADPAGADSPVEEGATGRQIFDPYLDDEAVRNGLQSGELFKGIFRASAKKTAVGYVTVDGKSGRKDSGQSKKGKDERDLVVIGKWARNRAVHGDIVAVKLIDERELARGHGAADEDAAEQPGQDDSDEEEVVLSQGPLCGDAAASSRGGGAKDRDRLAKVVAILEPKGSKRVIVCTLHRNDVGAAADSHNEIVTEEDSMLRAKPTDKRMPWILLEINDVTKRALNIPGRLDRFQLWPLQIRKWSEKASLPLGRLKGQCLGKAGELDAEEKHALIEHELNEHDVEFGDDLLNEVDQIVVDAKKDFEREVKRRQNLQRKRIFTIDPATAKDLDDAIHVDELENDEVEIGVHIADVGHFVKLGSKADAEAQYRTTSVYLMNRVLPMLPHGLCNHLCSLNVNDPKLSFSAFFRLKRSTGELCDDPKPWFRKTSMCSCCRLNYDEVQQVLDGEEIEPPPVYRYTWDDIKRDLFLLYEVCGKVRQGRFETGAMSISKTKLIFDTRESEDGLPQGYHFESHSASHWIIEELMLLANKCVATHLAHSPLSDVSVLRNHRAPDPEKQMGLTERLHDIGISWWDGSNAGKLYESCQRFYKEKGDLLGRCVEMLVMRSGMMQAEYFVYANEPEDAHHYALNFDFYTHFTSPIRRYPDIMVHRVLMSVLDEEKENKVDYQNEEKAGCQVTACNEKKTATRKCSEQLDRAIFCIYLRAKGEWFYTLGTVIGLPGQKEGDEEQTNGNDAVTVYCVQLGKESTVRLAATSGNLELFLDGVDDNLLMPKAWRFRGKGYVELVWDDPEGGPARKQVLHMFMSIPIVIIPTNTVPIDYIVSIVSPFHRKFKAVARTSPDCDLETSLEGEGLKQFQ